MPLAIKSTICTVFAFQDIAAVRKGEKLAEDGVEALSFFNGTSDTAFFMGIVSAAMKKSVKYNIKFVISKNGEIENSHCECPAGIGPHGTCKHLTAALLVLVRFVKTGELRVVKSCTETLQNFQTPKKLHQGSPVKAEKIGKGLSLDDVDPRPECFRNRASYQDDVRNLTVNFAFRSGLDIAMRHTFSKANLSLAILDHDYLPLPFTRY